MTPILSIGNSKISPVDPSCCGLLDALSAPHALTPGWDKVLQNPTKCHFKLAGVSFILFRQKYSSKLLLNGLPSMKLKLSIIKCPCKLACQQLNAKSRSKVVHSETLGVFTTGCWSQHPSNCRLKLPPTQLFSNTNFADME